MRQRNSSDEQRGYLFSSRGSSWWWIPPWQTCLAASICYHRDCSHIRLLCFDAFSIAGLCHELYILIWGSRLWWSDLSYSDCIDCINLSSWTFALCWLFVANWFVSPSTRMEIVCRQAKVISCNISAIEDGSVGHGHLGMIVPSLFTSVKLT